MTGYEFAREAQEARAALETLFMLAVLGDALGLPILPPCYGLRLLPFLWPGLASLKRRVARPRELGDHHEHHLHGV